MFCRRVAESVPPSRQEIADVVHQRTADGARTAVSPQRVPQPHAANPDVASAQSHRASDQNLVPEPAHETEARSTAGRAERRHADDPRRRRLLADPDASKTRSRKPLRGIEMRSNYRRRPSGGRNNSDKRIRSDNVLVTWSGSRQHNDDERQTENRCTFGLQRCCWKHFYSRSVPRRALVVPEVDSAKRCVVRL